MLQYQTLYNVAAQYYCTSQRLWDYDWNAPHTVFQTSVVVQYWSTILQYSSTTKYCSTRYCTVPELPSHESVSHLCQRSIEPAGLTEFKFVPVSHMCAQTGRAKTDRLPRPQNATSTPKRTSRTNLVATEFVARFTTVTARKSQSAPLYQRS